MPQSLRLCVMATIGKSIQVLYRGRLEYFRSQDFEITVVCAPSELDEAIRARGVQLFTAPLTRAITPLTDFRALWRLFRFLRRERFDIVEVSTPKAALLGSIAARLAGVQTVVHLLQGLAYEGKKGMEGWLIRTSTKIPCRLAHQTLSVSPSVRHEILAAGFCDPQRIHVLGFGTVNGIELDRFKSHGSPAGAAIRAKHNIPDSATVIGFVGRMVRDKGIEELISAFDAVHRKHPDAVLLIVGDYEARDCPSTETMEMISKHPAIRHVGWQDDVPPFLAAMDIFVLPTYREGLPTVLLEAAAAGLPTVTTNVTGARDAIVDGVTGLRIPAREVDALCDALARLIGDVDLRKQLGQAGRDWVTRHFEQHEVWQRQVSFYRQLLSEKQSGS